MGRRKRVNGVARHRGRTPESIPGLFLSGTFSGEGDEVYAMRSRPRTKRRDRGPGFTLIELLIVITIIGIILALILTAAMEGVHRAEERGTQALIGKLEMALSDRFDAVYQTRATANNAHAYLALLFNSSFGPVPALKLNGQLAVGQPLYYPDVSQRAQTIARVDYLKAELPDVFIVQADPHYPLNFGMPSTGFPGNPIPSSMGAPSLMATYAPVMLPLGVAILNDPVNPATGTGPYMGSASYGDFPLNPAGALPETTGIFGASYAAMGGVTKGLVDAAIARGATLPTPESAGFDGVDNDGNGLVDDIDENGASVKAAILTLLANHTHKTARSEMLYALLVNGQGPLGSSFTVDDFNSNEVKDTDGDGLMEFVDAWGEPLQFYRWPIGYSAQLAASGTSSDMQQGLRPYGLPYAIREQNPLDPSQSLMDPSWWANASAITGALSNNQPPFGTSSGLMSGSAVFFQNMFFTLSDPNYPPASGNVSPGPFVWDRGPTANNPANARRAYYSKFLVLSAGPDKVPGVPVLDPSVIANLSNSYGPVSSLRWFTGTGASATVSDLLIENQAAPVTPLRIPPYLSFGSIYPGSDAVSAALQIAAQDDISSHNLLAPGGAAQ